MTDTQTGGARAGDQAAFAQILAICNDEQRAELRLIAERYVPRDSFVWSLILVNIWGWRQATIDLHAANEKWRAELVLLLERRETQFAALLRDVQLQGRSLQEAANELRERSTARTPSTPKTDRAAPNGLRSPEFGRFAIAFALGVMVCLGIGLYAFQLGDMQGRTQQMSADVNAARRDPVWWRSGIKP